MLEDELSVALKPIVRALKTALARPSESAKDLKSATCREKAKPSVSEPLKDLKREFFSVRVEEEPIESVSDLARAFVCELVIDNELANVLNNEFFSAGLDTNASEPVKDRNSDVFSLNSDAGATEALKDLKREFFSARLNAAPIDPVKNLPTPLAWVEARDSELVIDLNTEFFCERPDV
jgi:hypothetical protein